MQRPAAVQQLKTLGEQIDVPVFVEEGQQNPVKVAKGALKKAKNEDFDVLIIDTAGRLHIDEELMEQLEAIKAEVKPCEILFVVNATMGQDAVKTASEFDKKVDIIDFPDINAIRVSYQNEVVGEWAGPEFKLVEDHEKKELFYEVSIESWSVIEDEIDI